MKKIIYICLTAIVLLAMNNKNTYSQYCQYIIPAKYPDLPAINNIDDVENTGNDVREFYGYNYDMFIMTWDGNAPGFAWDDALNGNTGNLDIEGVQQGTVTDPDIVLYDDGDMHTLIVYLLDDDVYYETWDYDGGANTWNLSSGPDPITTDGDCTCPNVDVDEVGNTVVVWEESNEIIAVAGDIQGNFQTELVVAEAHTPDVALNYLPSNQTIWVNFTFIENSGSNSYLSWIGTDYPTVVTGGNLGLGAATLYTAILSDGEYFGRPRIAGPILITPINSAEYEIVVKYYQSYRHYILSFNMNNPNSPQIVNDYYADLTYNNNKEPAVSYVGDNIVVTWTFDNDVISRQLFSDGTLPLPPVNPPPLATGSYNVYSIVNNNTVGNQGISSVAGRFSSNVYGEKKLVTFYNEDNSEVNYKIIPFASTQFRLKPPEIQADIYPNPTKDFINIKIDNEFETAKLELYNLQGQRLIQREITTQNFELDVSELNSGIYKLRIITDNSFDTKSIEILE